jgi:fibro-slime domain-containing protein
MRATQSVYIALGIGSVLSAGLILSACSTESGTTVGGAGNTGNPNPPAGGEAGGGGASGGTGGSTWTPLPDAAVVGGQGGSTEPTVTWPPPDFVNTTKASIGQYATSKDPLNAGGGKVAGTTKCTGILFGLVRDFQMSNQGGSNPDFELSPAADKGIVTDTLDSDGKPVYGDHPDGTKTTHGKDYFDQWYRDVDGVNATYVVALQFEQKGKIFTFAATTGNTGGTPNVSYFPLDGLGFNDVAQASDGKEHNFSFTTEIHTTFTYAGGETFTFQGDDDVFVYINNKLAIDLGGIHAQQNETVNLDEQASKLEISKGNTYPLAIFNAERHVVQSNFRIDTTMTFADCGIIPIL